MAEKGLFEVRKERFSLTEPEKYILQGIVPSDCEITVRLDAKHLSFEVQDWKSISAVDRFRDFDRGYGRYVTVTVQLPDETAAYRRLVIEIKKEDRVSTWYTVKTRDLLKKQNGIQFFLEEELYEKSTDRLALRGWAVDRKPVTIRLIGATGTDVTYDIQRGTRVDVVKMYEECDVETRCGFYIEADLQGRKKIILLMDSGEHQLKYEIDLHMAAVFSKEMGRLCGKGFFYLKMYGVASLMKKIVQKIKRQDNLPIVYNDWLPKHLPGKAELARQRKDIFDPAPVFSIVVPLYETAPAYLRALINSLLAQTYPHWELCLSDGSPSHDAIREIMMDYEDDTRIRITYADKPLRIAENTNAAITLATGDFIGFADHDDCLEAHTLYECAKAVREDDTIDAIYTDEDKMSMDGNKFFEPHFKPDFNIDLLRTVNYFCHFFTVKRSLLDQVGLLDPAYDGAQDYDFALRCVEKAEHIYHIPKILYHWRSHEKSTAENPQSKRYAFDAGRRAIQAHYDRLGIRATVTDGEYLGLYKTTYILDSKPMVSIIIPNKDHADDLDRCIASIEEKSLYENYEYVIVENNSTKEETFAYYRKLEDENPKAHVVYYEGGFNYSKINNFGAQHAMGEYLWLLNNDTAIINDDCIEQLVGYCTREDVGIVGARLYYEDDTIQHAGVVVGFAGIAGHCFVQQKRGLTGYCHRIICAQDYSAVTAACMMVKRSVFDEVGGLDEKFEVAFNDVDFCLRVRERGKLVVYNPYAELYHFESKSRGYEDTPEKKDRFAREIDLFETTWSDFLEKGDPYYNPNLTLESQDFSLKRL